jgi:hypothetical protein
MKLASDVDLVRLGQDTREHVGCDISQLTMGAACQCMELAQ